MNGCLKVADKSVRNFDMESYHKAEIFGFPLFLCASSTLTLGNIGLVGPIDKKVEKIVNYSTK
jgi:hypothetical protein